MITLTHSARVGRTFASLGLLLLASACADAFSAPIGQSDFDCAGSPSGRCASTRDVYFGSDISTAEAAAGATSDEEGQPAAVVDLRLAEPNLVATHPTPVPPPVDRATIQEARVLRIWVAPYTDDESDALVVSGYLFTEVAPRAWNVGFSADEPRAITFQPLDPVATPASVRR